MTRTFLHALALLLVGGLLWPDARSAHATPRRIVCDRTTTPAAALAIAAAPAQAARTGAAPIAVIFPREKEPYRTAFLSVVNGLRETLGDRAEVQEVEKQETASDIGARIAARDAHTVVLLGPYGLDLARDLDQHLDRVIGAVYVRPEQVPDGARGISVVPMPRSLFQKLRELAPGVKRISVVHGMDENDWLIERAAKDAADLGFGFTDIRRDTLSEGAKAYKELLDKLEAPQDALWLPPASRFVNEDSVMKMIVSEAWNKKIVVFSSTGAHVQRGALFALYPDYVEMGRALGRLASSAPAAKPELLLLEQLDTAINIKTAKQLELGLDAADPRFDLVFPNK